MKVFNETQLKVGWCVGRVPPHRDSATLLVKGTFRMEENGLVTPLPEKEQVNLSGDVFLDDDPNGALRYPSDFALYKPHADLMLTGSAYVPGSRPVTSCKVTFGVQGWSKTLLVVGDRLLRENRLGGRISDPQPFTRMSIGWERAFGGPGHPDNPGGRGYGAEKAEDGSSFRRYPNVEDPARLIVDATQKHAPAGFGPTLESSPQRRAKVGTFDKNWLKNNWPWFPDNFDWTYFNAAPVEQQVKAHLAGDETVHLENLHPTRPSFSFRLPGLRHRWFIRDVAGGSTRFREILLNLDTLWVDTDALHVVLVWRGVAPIVTKKMREISEHLIVSEPLATRPLATAHYEALLAEALKPPEKAPEPPPPEPPPEPPEVDWKIAMQAAVAQSEAEFKEVEALAQQAEAAGIQDLKAAGLDHYDLTKLPLKPDWRALWEREVAEYQQLMEAAPEAARAVPPPPPFAEYMKLVPEPEPDEPPAAGPEEEEPVEAAAPGWTRERVEQAVRAGTGLAGEDLTGLDLSGLDISGADLEKAVLAGADLSRATLVRTRLAGAVLAGARLKEADLSGADVSGADLTGTDLTLSVLKGARLDGATLDKAILAGADLSSASAVRARMAGADLTEANLQDGDFSSAVLAEANLSRANLGRAVLNNASVTRASGPGARLPGADLTKLHGAGCDFTGAQFTGVRGPASTWEDAQLEGADFSKSVMPRSNFINAALGKASFFQADLKHSSLAEAHLEGANMVQVNLFRGSLEGAFLAGADFRVSNLFQVEFLDADSGAANFRDANLKGTKLASG